MRRAAPLLALWAGCAPAPPPDGAPLDRLADLDGPGVVGVVLGADDQPIAGAVVLACTRTSCLTGPSDADGFFFFESESPARLALKTHAEPRATPRAAAALEPVTLDGDGIVDLGWLYVPWLPDGEPLAAATAEPWTFACGDGLELTIHTADLVPAIGDALSDVACAALPEEHRPRYPDLGGEALVAVYALHPFDATSASPIAVSAPADLPEGTLVHFRTVDALDGSLSPPVPGRADGARVATEPGLGIDHLTHLVISVPEARR